MQFDPQTYGRVFTPLLETDRRRPLDSGRPDSSVRAALKKLDARSAFAHEGTEPADAEMAACCIAGVWVLHDCLDESHAISQSIETPSGSFWHAIMHRREGDFWNSKYWFRRVGQHPAFADIAERASKLAKSSAQEKHLKKLVIGGAWDPFAFVDLCEAAGSNSADAHELCLDLQQVEWEALFDHCYHNAVGK
jgi:hypothetical protein